MKLAASFLVGLLGVGLCALEGCSSDGASNNAGSGASGMATGGAAGVAGTTPSSGEGGMTSGGATAMGGAGNGGSAGDAGNQNAGGGGELSACSVPAKPAAYPAVAFTPDQDTVAWYQLGDLTDSGAQALTLTNNGGVKFASDALDWSGSSKNAVARFTGAQQSLIRAGLTVGNDFTLDAHIYWRGFRDRACGGLAQIVALTSGSSGVSFGQKCGSAFGPRVRVNDTTDMVAPAAFEDLTDNAWHWLRFAIAGGMVSFSVDGKLLGGPLAVTGLGTSTWQLELGNDFYGDIDDVRLFKKALPAAETAPTVSARPTYSELAATATSAELTATPSDGAKLVWSKLSGPGNVLFDDATAATTHATFCAPGKYVLQATAYRGDGATTASDEVVVRVWPEGGRKEPYKVLFLGNSFTFYNGTVGYRFWELEKAAGEAVGDTYAASPYVKVMTSPGQTFQYHWYELNANTECTACTDHVLPAPPTVNLTDYSGKNAQDVIASGGWDVVVLHSYSTAASRDPDNFFRYGKKLDRLIKQSGARSVFYQTWAYPGADNTAAEEATLLGNYEELAKQTGAALSRVGQAFKDAHAQLNGWAKFPDGILFSDDKHPNSFGTYLSGSVHFGVIYGKSPVPVQLYPGPGDIPTPEITTDKTKADKLRAIAAQYANSAPLDAYK